MQLQERLHRNLSPLFAGTFIFIAQLSAQTQFLPFDHLALGPSQEVNYIYAIEQDREGFLWFGTLDGLVRYDGTSLRHYAADSADQSGLLQRYLGGLAEDRFGNLWVASRNYLQVLGPDRERFQTIPLPGSDSLLDHTWAKFAPRMLADRQGEIWIRSRYGLIRVRPDSVPAQSSVEVIPVVAGPDGAPRRWAVFSLLEDEEGQLWAGTKKGLMRVDRDSGKLVPCHPTANSPVISVLRLPDGRVLSGTQGAGIFVYDPASRKVLHLPPDPGNPQGLADGIIRQIVQDGSGRVWLLAGAKGQRSFVLQGFDPDAKRFWSPLPDPFLPGSYPGTLGNASRLFIDRYGDLWVVAGARLLRYERGREQFVEVREMQPYLKDWNFVSRVFEDRTGGIWFGTMSRGLLRFAASRQKFELLEYEPGDLQVSSHIPMLTLDSKGMLWYRAEDGLRKYAWDEHNGLHFLKVYPKAGSIVREPTPEDLWSFSAERLFHYDPLSDQWIEFRLDPGDPKSSSIPSVTGVLALGNGQLLVPTYGFGAHLIDPQKGRLKHFRHDPQDETSPSTNQLTGADIDKQGRIWIGSNKGLHLFHPSTGKFTRYPFGYPSNFTHIAKDGTIWLGSPGFGLFSFDPETEEFHQYHPRDGFPANRVSMIQEDDHGGLWIACYRGLVYFQPQTEEWRLYDEFDGLPPADWSKAGSLRLPDGSMLLRIPEGATIRFHPDSLRDDPFPARANLVDFQLANRAVEVGAPESPLKQPIWATETLELRYDQNVFTFFFSAFHYAAPERNQFAYRLEGVDPDWNYVVDRRSVNYAGLQPGRYLFRLKAANHDGLWGEERTLQLVIQPPWWRRSWAYVLYAGALFGTLLWFYRFQRRRWQIQAQLQLEQREVERLQEMDSLKTRLYTNITHEFRTPLTIILGMVDQVRDDPARWFREGLDLIRRNGKNLLRLVNQMLDLSQLESGTMTVHYQQGDILGFLEYLLESFRSLADRKQVEIRFQTELDRLAMDFDPEKVQTIVGNLLSNAVKFTPEGGQVSLSAGQVQFDGRPHLSLQVADDGPGIPSEHLPHIFDRFYQADTSSTREAEGSGIGLTLAKELVELLGGRIEVQSESGKGTQFTIRLPITREAPVPEEMPSLELPEEPEILAEASGLPDLPERNGKWPIVLIVEDNPDVIRYLRSILEERYQIETAANGRLGLEKAIEVIPDLIVSDVMMPEMDGYELCDRLKQDVRTSHIPIVLLTARADFDSRMEGLERGADAYLEKPFHKEELFIRLRKLLELRQELQEKYGQIDLADDPEVRAEPSAEDPFLRKMKELLVAHLSDEDFGIQELCQSLQLSRAQLYRKVQALTGRPAGLYIRSYRLHQARELLRRSEVNVSEAAYQCGFYNLSYFSRIFKEEFGVSPSEVEKDR